MRAAVIDEYGGPEVFRIADLPDPHPAWGQVLVRVHATSVNPVDYKMRQGHYRKVVRYTMPRILGLDVSGEVVALGEGVERWSIGDMVYGSPQHDLPGTYAELTCIRAEELWEKPRSISHPEAAALPLVFETAWQALVDTARLQPNEHCFVQAGSGGVGTMAIQIARHLGASVTTTCSARNEAMVRELGADRVVDYGRQEFDEVLSEVDVCLDTLGVSYARRALRTMNRGGRIVGITPNIPENVQRYGPWLGFLVTAGSIAGAVVRSGSRGVRTRFITRASTGATLEHCNAMLDAGALRPVIDEVMTLDQIAQAHRRVETRRARGKVVLTLD